MKKPKAIIVSGYFNPIHKGHLEYFELAKKKGDLLFVIVNSDHQRELKGSKAFQEEDERLLIVRSMRVVDKAILSQDKDRTVCATLELLHQQYGKIFQLAFANGGDQNNQVIPEREICERLGIELIDGLGDKIQSSSWLLDGKNEL
jgi:cytidyltransferase-like protein